MTQCISPDTKIEDTGFGYTLSIIGGKYKMIVLYWLGEFGTLRHNALHRLIGKISFKMLSTTLKELEKDGSLIPMLFALCEWGDKHRPK